MTKPTRVGNCRLLGKHTIYDLARNKKECEKDTSKREYIKQ